MDMADPKQQPPAPSMGDVLNALTALAAAVKAQTPAPAAAPSSAAPAEADPVVAPLKDPDARLRALEVTLGHPPDEKLHRLVTLAQPRRVYDAEVDPSRVTFTANPVTGQRMLVFDGKPCPRGIIVVDGVRCFVVLGADTDAAKLSQAQAAAANAAIDATLDPATTS